MATAPPERNPGRRRRRSARPRDIKQQFEPHARSALARTVERTNGSASVRAEDDVVGVPADGELVLDQAPRTSPASGTTQVPAHASGGSPRRRHPSPSARVRGRGVVPSEAADLADPKARVERERPQCRSGAGSAVIRIAACSRAAIRPRWLRTRAWRGRGGRRSVGIAVGLPKSAGGRRGLPLQRPVAVAVVVVGEQG
jgi:hypothetical protein